DVEYRVGDVLRRPQVEPVVLADLEIGEDHVAQHREDVLADAADHLAVDERRCRGPLERHLEAAVPLDEADAEIAIPVEHLARVVRVAAAVEHGEDAAAQQRIQSALALAAQELDLEVRQDLEAAFRPDLRVHGLAGIRAYVEARCGCLLQRVVLGNEWPVVQGRISMGTRSGVMSQMSIMSELDTAMQQLVQSAWR